MTETVLAVRNLSKAFTGVQALDDVNLEIKAGEIHCLAGENGSGKSTLIKIVSGAYTPDSGVIEVGGHTFEKMTPVEAIDNGIQVIYQDFSIFPNLTVLENLALNTELAQKRKFVNWRRFRQIAEQAVQRIGFKVDLDAHVEDLSVADKQLVAICRALISDTKLIIMDEPTTALTGKEVAALFRVIKDLQSRGIATLFVSHKLDEVFEISEHFTIIRNGKLVVTAPTADLTRQKFSQYMTGREFDDIQYEPAPDREETLLLEAEGLGIEGAFEDVSLSLRSGEILGITGLLGSGRTELALALFGVFPPERGRVSILGKDVKIRNVADAIAAGIGYVPEDRLTEGLMLERSIADNIVVSSISEITGFLGSLKERDIAAAADHWVETLKIATKNPQNAVNTLSGGNQQRVVLAKWLATKPKILILNGPTVGVDIGSKHDINMLLHELARNGMGIIVISDDIPELIQTSSRIVILHEGKLVEEVKPSDVSEQELSDLISRSYSGEGMGA